MKKVMFMPVLLALAACGGASNINEDKVFFAWLAGDQPLLYSQDGKYSSGPA